MSTVEIIVAVVFGVLGFLMFLATADNNRLCVGNCNRSLLKCIPTVIMAIFVGFVVALLGIAIVSLVILVV